jgi:hypothetical protein
VTFLDQRTSGKESPDNTLLVFGMNVTALPLEEQTKVQMRQIGMKTLLNSYWGGHTGAPLI